MDSPILKQDEYLIATVQSDLSDPDLSQFRDSLVEQVSRHRARAVVVDVSSMDVMDSFATRTMQDLASTVRSQGAEMVVVGIQPDVAFAMVQLGLSLQGIVTALDLDEGLAYLSRKFEANGNSSLQNPSP